jgi:pimeloyl-ACP methyl ester carboxylesterase
MQTVTSSDGTTIAYEQFSDGGPPLLKVVGAFSDRASAAPLTEALSDHYAVYGYDRRGRGDSGAGETAWSVQRELEDLNAVLAALAEHGPMSVFGHSSGGALALEAAAAQAPFARLVVYEPPYTGTEGSSLRRAAELQELAATGRLEDAAALFLTGSGVPAERVDQMRRWDGWPGMVARAGTLGYEVGCCNDGVIPADRLAAIDRPVLAAAGGAGPAWATDGATAIAGAVPGGRSAILEGQDHNPAPEALVPLLMEFLASAP